MNYEETVEIRKGGYYLTGKKHRLNTIWWGRHPNLRFIQEIPQFLATKSNPPWRRIRG